MTTERGGQDEMAEFRSMMQQLKRKKEDQSCLIDPRSSRLATWDLIGGVALIYTAIVCPFEVAFLDLPETH